MITQKLHISGGVVETFDFLRFPLICMVVLIHTLQGDTYKENMALWYGNVIYFFQEALSRSAVPVFFVISGYLFCYNMNRWDWTTYYGKLKKRVYTLLIPYLIWNSIALCETSIKHLPLLSSFFPNIYKQELNSMFLIGAYWTTSDGSCPILYPFWYIRDLMVMVILSPIFYYVIKKMKILWIALLVIGSFTGIKTIPGFAISSMLYFSIGCYWSIIKKDCMPNKYILMLFFILSFPIALADTYTRIDYLHTLSVMCGTGCILAIGFYLTGSLRLNANKQLTKSVFFVFAVHAILLGYISKIIFLIVKPETEFLCLITYITVWFLTIIFSLLAYQVINTISPKVIKVLTGGRN